MNKPKILIVDDEEDLCEILQFNLESDDFDVDTVYSAEEALKKQLEDYDVLLLDVMMEGMSGFKLADKIRKEEKLEVPIIFLTAKDTENDMLTGFNLGGDDYISKPFSIKEVSARIKAVIRRNPLKEKKKNLPEILSFDSMEINTIRKNLKIDGNNIQLTKKEFEILILLCLKPGNIYSREDILDKVWRDEAFVMQRTVDVHITRLRKKLGNYGKCIINRSGYGYCFELI